MILTQDELNSLIRKILTGSATPEELAKAYGLIGNPNASNVERQALEAALNFVSGKD
jgi:hypothetical protein